jgi:hypothetical protein
MPAIHTTNHSGAKAQRGLEQHGTPVCAIRPLPRVEPLPLVLNDDGTLS